MEEQKRIDKFMANHPKSRRESVERLLRWQEHAKDCEFCAKAPRHGFTLERIQNIMDGKE